MDPGPNRRQRPRQASDIIAEYKVTEGTFRDIIKNIGAGGLFVQTDRKIATGQPITIEFPLFQFDHTIQAAGRIVRNDPHGFAVTFDKVIHGLICKDGLLPEIIHESDRSPSE